MVGQIQKRGLFTIFTANVAEYVGTTDRLFSCAAIRCFESRPVCYAESANWIRVGKTGGVS